MTTRHKSPEQREAQWRAKVRERLRTLQEVRAISEMVLRRVARLEDVTFKERDEEPPECRHPLHDHTR